MAKLLYENKEDIYVDSSIPDKNKVKADDMNEIKEVVNANENKILLAISDTAPSTCATGDLYYNTTSKKIFEATDTNTWGTTGTNPTPNTIYILFDTKTTYSYDGTDLVSVGGGGAEVAVSSTEPTGEDDDSVKIWINPNEAPSGSLNPISNTYGVAQDKGYSQEYINWKLAGTNTGTGYIAIPSGAKELHIVTHENDQLYIGNVLVSDLTDGDYLYDGFYLSSSNNGTCAWQYSASDGIHCLTIIRGGTNRTSESTTKVYYK